MGAVGKFLLDKLIKYGIEILVKMILKWLEEQERQNGKEPGKTPSTPKPPEQGWNDKQLERHLNFKPDRMMK
jgi:hypothetical protein